MTNARVTTAETRALNLRKYSPILAAALTLTPLLGCRAQDPSVPDEKASAGLAVASGVVQIGRLTSSRLTESSGLAVSRQFPGTLWTHNDGGGAKRQVLYAVTRSGQLRAEFRVTDVFLTDWEDIAIDDNKHLYLADIGNNEGRRDEVAVHQISEPNPSLGDSAVSVQRTWRLKYPGARFDAEALFVWKTHGYIVSKVLKDARAEIYRFPLEATPTGPATLEFVAQTKIESPVTGADISTDGRLLALVAKSGAFVIPINGNPSRAHKEKGYQTRFRHDSIEGCSFAPEGLLCTAESREIFLFTDPPFRGD